MEFNKLLELRRSVRSFNETKQVSEEQIKELVTAGIQAPSWKNSQTARYYCILNKDARENFSKNCLPEFNIKNSEGAALVVTTFVSNRSGFSQNGISDNECGNGWGYYDLGLHNENFILKAKELGLDTLIMGIRNSEAIRKELNIPETETIVSVIAVGYGTVVPNKPKRKNTEDILKFY